MVLVGVQIGRLIARTRWGLFIFHPKIAWEEVCKYIVKFECFGCS